MNKKYDFVGSMTGVVERNKMIDGKISIKTDDLLIGLPSSGLHTNGYSLIRSLMDKYPDKFTEELMNKLCVPHKSYLSEILSIINNDIELHALCHITGGGFDDNIKRVMPNDKYVVYNNFEFSELFTEIQQIGTLTNRTMKEVFNCGYGMILFIPNNMFDKVNKLIEGCVKLGYVKSKIE